MKNVSKFIVTIFCLTFVFNSVIAQNKVVQATEILKKINRKEEVKLEGVTIEGDLDFTVLDRKFRGGSYGVRNGVVKEFFTKLLAPLTLIDCTIKGEVITFSTSKTPGVLKENFVAFDELAVFENCRFEDEVAFERMTFYKGIEIRNCTFENDLKFEKVHFSMAPFVEGGNAKDKLKLQKTNWDEIFGKVAKKEKKESTNDVTIILKNDTFNDIQIRFGQTKWNLSAHGHSSVMTTVGTKIYLLKDGKNEQVLLIAEKEIDGQEFKLSKLKK